MKFIEELMTVLPFYKNIQNQDRFKENVKNLCAFQLLSPSNAMLPFMLRLPKSSGKPIEWNLIDLNGTKTDISNNISLLKAQDFDDFAYCYYKGEEIIFKHGTIEQPLNLCGFFYSEIVIDDVQYFSEVFYMTREISNESFSDKFVKIEFSDETDVEPLRYREDFKQVIYLDTFIHTSESEIIEETEPDGDENKIQTFAKLILKQKIEVIVPDFLKNALLTIMMHDDVYISEQNKRQGKIDRKSIVPTVEANGALFTLDISFETDVLVKKSCEENKTAINENLWQ